MRKYDKLDLDTPVDKNVTESLDRVFDYYYYHVARLTLNEQAPARGEPFPFPAWLHGY